MALPPTILWLRQDLRLHDQPALFAAVEEGAVVPVYILDDETAGQWKIGGAQRWWLHRSLDALQGRLAQLGSSLVLRRGETAASLTQLAAELGTRRIHATRHYEPWWRDAEQRVGACFDLVLHPGNVLVPPEQVRSGGGTPYKIYTPYWRALQEHLPPSPPLPAPERLQPPEHSPSSENLNSWGLLPTCPNWAEGFGEQWAPGEEGALSRLITFADHAQHYGGRRDLPSEEGTSRFSPHLHFGELSPRQIWHRFAGTEADKFRKELAWRDFSHNVMLSQPAVGEKAGRPGLQNFPWREGPAADADFAAWTKGRTGYPVVDAGMRQLWATGWMHNRVRMIVASFLVKHLLIDWRRGAQWFWDTLVDADYGNNGQNWQWVAGTGLDSQPFPRIMAPILQSHKFGAADYIRRWVSELRDLSDEHIHEPGDRAPPTYPPPIVGHRSGRERALATFAVFSSGGAATGT